MLCLSLALSVYFYFCQSCIRLCISLQRKADFFFQIFCSCCRSIWGCCETSNYEVSFWSLRARTFPPWECVYSYVLSQWWGKSDRFEMLVLKQDCIFFLRYIIYKLRARVSEKSLHFPFGFEFWHLTKSQWEKWIYSSSTSHQQNKKNQCLFIFDLIIYV